MSKPMTYKGKWDNKEGSLNWTPPFSRVWDIRDCNRLIEKCIVDDGEKSQGWMSKTKERGWWEVDGQEVGWLSSI